MNLPSDKQIKILQIGKFYPIRGGVEKVMYDLTEGISQQQIRCDMLCASTEDYPAGDIVLNDCATVMVVPTKVKVAATMLAPSMISKLRKIAKNYDVIHVHHPDPMAALALYLSGYKGIVVLHWHSDIVKQRMLLRMYSPLQSWLIARADSIVGTTPVYVQQSPFLAKVQHKVDYIPIGIEPVRAIPAAVQQIKEKYEGRKIVFSLGRLVEYKGYEYLIRAAQFLPDDVQVVIGGKGPLKEALTNLIVELGVRDKVELIDFIPDEQVAAYFQASELFCLSSILKTEAFAIVQIEAMSCAKPVVSTRIPGSGVSWVNSHQQSGLTVQVADPQALAAAINSLLSDPAKYQVLSDGAQQRYTEMFTRRAMVEKSLSLYHTLLQESPLRK